MLAFIILLLKITCSTKDKCYLIGGVSVLRPYTRFSLNFLTDGKVFTVNDFIVLLSLSH